MSNTPITLSDVSDRLCNDRVKYRELTVKNKESNFFILNRYFLKKYPDLSVKLNNKYIDKSLGLDILYLNTPIDKYYKTWLWKNNKVERNKSKYSKVEINFLIDFLDLKDVNDIERLARIDEKYIYDILKEYKNEYGK